MLQKVFGTKNEVIIVPIPGQLAVEMAAVNLVAKGDEAFVCVNGLFSNSILEAINAVGGKAVAIQSRLGTGPTLEEVKAAIDGAKDVSREDHLRRTERDLHRRGGQPRRDLPLLQEEGDVHSPGRHLRDRRHGAEDGRVGRRLLDRLLQQGPRRGQRRGPRGNIEGGLGPRR